MKKSSKILATVLALMLLVSLPPAAVAEEAATYWTKFETPIDVQMTKSIWPDHATKYATLGETAESNRWLDLYREELGINITYKFVATAGDSYDTKTQMMLASGKIPDIFLASLSDMAELQEGDMIWDMTEIYEQYLSPLAKKILEADGGGAKASMMIDGRLYGLPQVTSVYDTLRFMYIRADWMEALGLEDPESVDDLLKIMEAFVKNDPDGNGVDDTYAMYVDKDLWTQLEGFFWMFGAYPNGFVEKDGKLVYGATQPEAKEALRTLNMMYKEGWIDKEFVVKPFSQAKELVTNGKVGVVMGFHWMPLDVTGPMHDLYPDVEWNCYPFPSTTAGEPAVTMTQSALTKALVVNKNFAHPEIAAYLINLYVEKLYGETNEYDYYGDDAEHGVQGVRELGPLNILEADLNLRPYREMKRVWAGEITPDDLDSYCRRYYDGTLDNWATRTMWGPGEHTAGTVLEYLVSTPGKIIQNAYVAVPTETQAMRGGSLSEVRKTAYTQIITGKADVDAGFDKFVQDYTNAGGQKIEDEVNAWYQANHE